MSSHKFSELLVICDDKTWVWSYIHTNLNKLNREHIRLESSVPIRQSWSRFKGSEKIIVHWENFHRSGGAVIEELMDVDPFFSVADRVIVLTNNPTHSDVVYLSELGIKQVVRLENNGRGLRKAGEELQKLITTARVQTDTAQAWEKILKVLNHVTERTPPEQLQKLSETIKELRSRQEGKETALYHDAAATLAAVRGDHKEALSCWQKALELNPHYYRAYNNLIDFYKKSGMPVKALTFIKKMHTLNKNSISRMVKMGEIHLDLDDMVRAEHYFQLALQKDKYASRALNGLAEIRFRQDQLEEARQLLSRSQIAYKAAAALNKIGINLVKQGRYKDALEHYSKAQYVLPQQDKGPMLFYNIGLCYSRWGKPDMAREFLTIALIKEPNYQKARRLLEQLGGGKAVAA